MVQECIFCEIISGRITTTKLWESDQVIAFRDAHPSAETHLLIIPKQHLVSFHSTTDPVLWEDMRQAARQLIRDFDLVNGYKLVINGGKYQHIPHLHWHLLGGELKTNP